jgi:hypothetical protein
MLNTIIDDYFGFVGDFQDHNFFNILLADFVDHVVKFE